MGNIFQSGKSQGIMNRLEKSGNLTHNIGKVRKFSQFLFFKFERGYNPETPSNFPYHSKVVLIRWHAHLGWDWWRLPSGEAALASPLWQTPSNSSLDWAIVGVALGPDLEVSVWVLVSQCWGITLGQGSWHLSRMSPGRVQGEGLCWGQQEAGTRA